MNDENKISTISITTDTNRNDNNNSDIDDNEDINKILCCYCNDDINKMPSIYAMYI